MAKQLGSRMKSTPFITCIKTLMMVFNFIFWITGIAILALGIWTKIQLYMYMELTSQYYKEAPYAMIGIGAVIVLVGSLGCCCTIKGSALLLRGYGVFLFVVFIAELGAGIAGFVYKNKGEDTQSDTPTSEESEPSPARKRDYVQAPHRQQMGRIPDMSSLEEGFKEGITTAINNYEDKGYVTTTEAIDGLQRNLKCCGVDVYSDWFTGPWEAKQKEPNMVPKSCCQTAEDTCVNVVPPGTVNSTEIYTEGCYSKVVDFMHGNMALIGGVALGISFFQLLGTILACFLARSINKATYEQVA